MLRDLLRLSWDLLHHGAFGITLITCTITLETAPPVADVKLCWCGSRRHCRVSDISDRRLAVDAQQGGEHRHHRRAGKNPDRAIRFNAARQSEKEHQCRQIRAMAHRDRFHEIVDNYERNRGPRNHYYCT